MNNVLAQSATQLTVSPNGEATFDFAASVNRASERRARGLTKTRHEINRQKLIASVCADYRAHFASIYGKTERLPSEVFDKIQNAVDEFITKLLSQVNTLNSTTIRRSFAHKPNAMKFVSRVTAIGEDEISLDEQLFACHIAQGQVKRRIEDLEKANRLSDDTRKELQSQIMRLTLTENFIKGEIEHQKKLASEASKSA